MTNEELEEQILSLFEERYCKPCQGQGQIEVFRKYKEPRIDECTNCDGTGKMPSYFAQELADKLRGL